MAGRRQAQDATINLEPGMADRRFASVIDSTRLFASRAVSPKTQPFRVEKSLVKPSPGATQQSSILGSRINLPAMAERRASDRMADSGEWLRDRSEAVSC